MNITEELKKLADLRRDGVLTEQEFTIAKSRLLSQEPNPPPLPVSPQPKSVPSKPKKKWGCGTLAIIAIVGFFLLGIIFPLIIASLSPSQNDSSRVNIEDIRKKREEAQKRFESSIDEKYTELIQYRDSGDTGEALRIIRQFENFKQAEFKDFKKIATEVRIVDAISRLKEISADDIQALSKVYSELSTLDPNNPDFTAHADKYALEWGRIEEQRRQVEEARLKKEQEEEALRAAAAARKARIEKQFSGWNGAHTELTRIIKSSMNDPKSYEHVKTVYWDMGDHLVVQTTFRGKNAFGGVVQNLIKAKFTLDGTLIEIMK